MGHQDQGAKRQLHAAIRFFFERRDPVIIHTLVAAGHQVLTDLRNASGVAGLLKGKGQSAEQLRNLNYAANFSKHADKDPNGRINIEPLRDFTDEFLMDAVVLVQRLDGDLPIEAKLFWSWFVTKHEELFEGSGEALQGLVDIGLDPDNFEGVVALLTFHDLKTTAINSAESK